VHRVDLLTAAVGTGKHSLATQAGAMNMAATQDLRAVRVLPVIADVLRTGPAPTPRAERMLSLLQQWRTNGSSRLDRDLDGKVDDPGAAIMDAAWPRLATAVMTPRPRCGADRPPRRAARDLGRREQPGLLLHRRLVRLRRQGPASAARPARPGRVPQPLLRRRRPGRMPSLAVGRARRGRRCARGEAGRRPGRLASGRERRADPVRARNPHDDDALVEPADVPAGDLVFGAPLML
jgi:hypothetical protein